MLKKSIFVKLYKNLNFLKQNTEFLDKKTQEVIVSENKLQRIITSYIFVSSLYFYLENRILFSKPEICSFSSTGNLKSISSSEFDTEFRKNFLISNFYSTNSLMSKKLTKMEQVLGPFWDKFWSRKQPLFSKTLDELEIAQKELMAAEREITERLIETDTQIVQKNQVFYRKSLYFLTIYARLFKLRNPVVKRLEKTKSKKQSSFLFLLVFDTNLRKFGLSLKTFAFCLLIGHLPYIKIKLPPSLKNFQRWTFSFSDERAKELVEFINKLENFYDFTL